EDAAEVASTQENPQENLERSETGRIVQDAINSLPKKQRMALLLNRYEGLSYEEIAKVMNVSVPSVESRLHRAKQALAMKLIALRQKD
ncbi:MAG TPA: sigma-70 family RNA polymerase sigma factor, partial [Candidatus Kryptobacter bacterium]|nr:sigma-70 family RNA polymerase sigma factor [Candidatus Kryptobacter bacterium]